MCFRIRILSSFHLDTQTMPILNLNRHKNTKTLAQIFSPAISSACSCWGEIDDKFFRINFFLGGVYSSFWEGLRAWLMHREALLRTNIVFERMDIGQVGLWQFGGLSSCKARLLLHSSVVLLGYSCSPDWNLILNFIPNAVLWLVFPLMSWPAENKHCQMCFQLSKENWDAFFAFLSQCLSVQIERAQNSDSKTYVKK